MKPDKPSQQEEKVKKNKKIGELELEIRCARFRAQLMIAITRKRTGKKKRKDGKQLY